MAPQVPGLMTDFMASRRAGVELHCEDFVSAKQPPDCRNAYSDVVWWSTSTSFFTNSVLTFIMVRSAALLPAKSQVCFTMMWELHCCLSNREHFSQSCGHALPDLCCTALPQLSADFHDIFTV